MLQYREGIADFSTVLTAEQNLLTQGDSLARAPLGDISSNLVGVYRALDGGWQIREGQEVVAPEIKTAMAARINWGNLLTVVTLPPQL